MFDSTLNWCSQSEGWTTVHHEPFDLVMCLFGLVKEFAYKGGNEKKNNEFNTSTLHTVFVGGTRKLNLEMLHF